MIFFIGPQVLIILMLISFTVIPVNAYLNNSTYVCTYFPRDILLIKMFKYLF